MKLKIEILFLTIVFTLFMFEGIVRVFFKNQIDSKILSNQFYKAVNYVELTDNKTLMFQLKKDFSSIDRNVSIQTNQEGCRVSSIEKETTDTEAIKIAIVGDSTAFGWGVEYENTYACLLAKKLEKETGKKYIVKNYCVPGYNTIQELEVYRTKVKQWNPDILLIHHDNNDPETYGEDTFVAKLSPEYGNTKYHCALYKFTVRTIKKALMQAMANKQKEKHQFVQVQDIISVSGGPIYDEHIKALDTLINESESNGTKTITVLSISYVFQNDESSEKYYEKLHKPLEKHLLDNGKNVWDMYHPAMNKIKELGLENTSSWWVSPETHDYHLNNAGHEFVAESLKGYMFAN